MDEVSNRGDKFRDQLSRTELHAPMSGIVKQLYVNNIGGVVPPGGTVLDLVPGDGGIMVEAKLPTQDIGFIHIGQKAFVQLASAEATRYGRIEGKVVHISPDSVTNKDQAPAPGALATYYIVRIETAAGYFGAGDMKYELTPGVQVSAGIVTGSRTVLAYLLYPIFRTMPFALSER
jgi:adhesin transport system membrane fusion protein